MLLFHRRIERLRDGIVDAEDRLDIGISVQKCFCRIRTVRGHVRRFVVFLGKSDAVLLKKPDIDLLTDLRVTAVRTAPEHTEPGKSVHIDQTVHRFFDTGLVVIIHDNTVIDIRCCEDDRRIFHLFLVTASCPH